MLVAHCCDDDVELIQSLISCVAAFPSLFSPFCPSPCVCVCVVSQGWDAIMVAREEGYGAWADEVEVRPTAVVVMVLLC